MAISKAGISLFLLFKILICQVVAFEPSVSSEFREETKSGYLRFEHFASTGSTQDEARRIVSEDDLTDYNMVSVTATEQTNGRGTSGRVWMGAKGNTFVTIAIPTKRWLDTKIPLTLLPLEIGIIVARKINQLIRRCRPIANDEFKDYPPRVTLKWPNDVLVNEKKIAGILIESSDNGWFLIGIGVNLAHAPPIPTSGPNYGRRSTSVSEFCAVTDWEKEARELAVELANDLHSFLENLHSSPTTIIEEWKRWVDSDMELVMRDTPKRERVKMVDMLLDGRIQVIGQDDGIQRTLVSDYFV